MVKVLGTKVTDKIYKDFKELSGGHISSLLRSIINEYIQNHSSSHQHVVNHTDKLVNLPIAKKTEQDKSGTV